MARRNKPLVEDILITGLAEKGRGVGRDAGGKVYFIKDTAPGDIVDAQVFRARKGFVEAFVTRYKHYSPDRAQPFCPHFDYCGGCSFQHIQYSMQLAEKQRMVSDAFRRIGHLDVEEVRPILGNQHQTHYRNKLEFAFSAKRWLSRTEMGAGLSNQQDVLGFHPQKAFDKVLDLQTCFLQEDPSEPIRRACLEIGKAQQLSFYDVMAHQGFLRQLVIRVFTTGQVMVIVGFGEEDDSRRTAYLDALLAAVPTITSLHYFVNTKVNDFFLDLPVIAYFGPEKVEEQLGHVRYAIGPKSFFQTNSRQALRLFEIVRDFAALNGSERVYDLYTGLGSIALFLAGQCREIVGIEEVAAAITDARHNAALNGITNATFYDGDVRTVMDEAFIRQHGRPDLLITDPPRAGMHPEVVASILKMGPDRIVYVSCNPATQARDLQLLHEQYRITRSQAVDMFPHTHHVENVALLEKRKPD